ncbi:Ldh family oxidoreductase [Tsukamurella soli]|uniref:Ldh family oxidoreductase n=1 Tax=Tsukamurella soli TaxID=644556 RepID=A0ABP8JUQ6_9ACTN
MATDTRRYPREELQALAAESLAAVGAPPDEAEFVAATLVSADARGIHSHGLLRLPLYVESVEAGGIVAGASLRWAREVGATAVLDGGSGFGQVIMQAAVDKARDLAGRYGTATVAVQRGTHYGVGAYWTDQLARDGMIGILVSTTGNSVAPHGSADKFIGTNPLSISFPTGGRPVTADMATSAGAYGKLVDAAGAGREIPAGWAVDHDGVPTTDANAAVAGALIPFGGHKGSAIAVLVELLAGAGGGGNFAYESVDIWNDRSSQIGAGALLIAIDLETLHGDRTALDRAASFRADLTGLRPAKGTDRVLAPGDPEQITDDANGADVTIPAHIDDALRATHLRVTTTATAR